MAGDPTLDFLRDLDDPSKFSVVRGVPLMKPHTRKVPAVEYGGKKYEARTVVVTEADLPKIASAMQRQEASATLSRGTPGHVKPGGAETNQPPVYCYYRNARVGTFGPLAEPAVLVDEYRKVEHAADVAENFPYRSADFYPDALEIFGVALLTQRPALDLGTIRYSHDRGVCYQYGDIDMPAAPTGPTGPSNAAPPTPAPGGPQQPGQPQQMQCSPEEEAQYQRAAQWLVQKGYCKAPQAAAAPAPEPKPDAPATPTEKPEPKGDEPKKEPPVSNANDAVPVQYQAQIDAAEKRAADAERKAADATATADRETCRVVLYGLQAEGFQFSREQFDKELGKLAKLPAAERAERAGELRLMYAKQQVPGGGRVELYQDNNPVETPAATAEQVQYEFDQKVLQYIRSHPGVRAEDAEERVRAAAK